MRFGLIFGFRQVPLTLKIFWLPEELLSVGKLSGNGPIVLQIFCWLWRAIGANGDVLDILVQPHRNAKAAKRFFRCLVAEFGEPRVVITDKLRSYLEPIHTVSPTTDHRAHKELDNAIEVSTRPTRKREKIFGRFKSPRQAHRFLSAHDQVHTIFRPRRYQLTAASYRHASADTFRLWDDYTAEMTA